MTTGQHKYQGILSGIGVKSSREATLLIGLILLVALVVGYALFLLTTESGEQEQAVLHAPDASATTTAVSTPAVAPPKSDEEDPATQSRIAYESGRAAEFSGDRTRAYEAYRQAITNIPAPDKGTMDQYVERMRAFARMARATGRLEEAEQTLKQTIEAVSGNSGDGTAKASPLTVSLTGELANVSLKRQNYVAAANYAHEVIAAAGLDLTSRAIGDEQAVAVTIAALDTLSDAQKASGNLADAIAASEEALVLTKKSVGPLSPSVGLRLERLAVWFEEYDKPLTGLGLRAQALAIAEVDTNIDRDELTINLNNLAEAYRQMGEMDLATPLYKKAIQIAETTHGSDAAEAAVPLNNLGLLAQRAGNRQEAEDYYMKALTIIWNSMGPEHDVTQRVLANVVRLLEAQGRSQDISTLKTKYGPS